jgi:hypothetical protein
MYLDTGTIIGITIALAACILTIVYSMYIISTQNGIIKRMNSANVALRKQNMERQ